MSSDEYYIRKFYVRRDGNECELQLHQKSIGDVSCIVWDAAIALAKFLEVKQAKDKHFLAGRKVLELGAGVGCVGLTAAVFGANVILTDLKDALQITRDNIEFNRKVFAQNGGLATAETLNWVEDLHQNFAHSFDVVLFSDCVYYESCIESLVQTLIAISSVSKSAVILQCQELRSTRKQEEIWKKYLDDVGNHFHLEEIPQSEQHADFVSSYIKIFKLVPKQSNDL